MARLQKIVGDRIAELDISQAEAARRSGLERTFIRDIVNGRKETVRGSNLSKLAEGLGIPVEELLNPNELTHTGAQVATIYLTTDSLALRFPHKGESCPKLI